VSEAIVRTVPVLTEAGARTAIDAAVAEARANGWAFGIAVVDSFAELLAFHRMDGSNIVTIETAMTKAKSAARMGMPTVRLRDMLDAGALSVLTIPGVVPLGGGVPIVHQGVMIGAIGVSGGTLEQDIQVAKAGRDAVTA
jgi:glc operon protein GlcG